MHTYIITQNGFIKTFTNGNLVNTLFDTPRQRKGLIRDGFIQVYS